MSGADLELILGQYTNFGTPIWVPKFKKGRKRKTNVLHKNNSF